MPSQKWLTNHSEYIYKKCAGVDDSVTMTVLFPCEILVSNIF